MLLEIFDFRKKVKSTYTCSSHQNGLNYTVESHFYRHHPGLLQIFYFQKFMKNFQVTLTYIIL